MFSVKWGRHLYYTRFILEEMQIQKSPESPGGQSPGTRGSRKYIQVARPGSLFCVFPRRMGSKDKAPSSPLKEIWADCWEATSLGVSDAQEALERPSGRPLGSCLPCIPRWPRAVARRASGSLINHSVAPHGDQPTAPHLSSLTCRILTLKGSMAFPWRGAPSLPKVGSRNHLSLHVELLGFAVSLPGAQT